jgi:hypothetical protein
MCYTNTRTHIHTHTYTHANTHTHSHTHTQTHIHTQVLATNDVPPVFTADSPVDKEMSWLPQFRYCRSFENPNILVPVW